MLIAIQCTTSLYTRTLHNQYIQNPFIHPKFPHSFRRVYKYFLGMLFLLRLYSKYAAITST